MRTAEKKKKKNTLVGEGSYGKKRFYFHCGFFFQIALWPWAIFRDFLTASHNVVLTKEGGENSSFSIVIR